MAEDKFGKTVFPVKEWNPAKPINIAIITPGVKLIMYFSCRHTKWSSCLTIIVVVHEADATYYALLLLTLTLTLISHSLYHGWYSH